MTTTFKDGEQVEVACLGMKGATPESRLDGDQAESEQRLHATYY
jgi:hypothetical protein